MARKKSKLLPLVVISAAAAGAYYYFKKKNEEIPENMDDEDLDNFEEDVEEASSKSKRSYVSLDFNTVEKKVQEAVTKVADTADKAASVIGEKLQSAAGKVEEFFDDRKPAEAEDPTESDGEAEAAAEAETSCEEKEPTE